MFIQNAPICSFFPAIPSIPRAHVLSHKFRHFFAPSLQKLGANRATVTGCLRTASDAPLVHPISSPFVLQFFPGMGICACAIDSVIEARGIQRSLKFLSHPSCKEPQSAFRNIYSSYLTIPQEKLENWTQLAKKCYPNDLYKQREVLEKEKSLYLHERKLELGKCVGHRFADTLEKTIPALLKQSISSKTVAEDLLLKKIRTQALKSTTIRVVGLLGAVLTGISFLFAGFIATGGLLPLVLGVIGALFYLTRFALSAILPNIDGWKFSCKTALQYTMIEPITRIMDSVKTAYNERLNRQPFENRAAAS